MGRKNKFKTAGCAVNQNGIPIAKWIYLLHQMIFIVSCVFGFIHLGITLFLALAFRRYQSGASRKPNSISVVIAARNEEFNLKQLVPLLLEQDFVDFEIIIALDRCTDLSKAYLESLNNPKIKIIEIQTVDVNWNPKKFALNEAITKTKGDWLVFTDADCAPATKNWLNSISHHMIDHKNIIIGISPYRVNGSLLSNFIRFESFMTAFMYISRALRGKPYMAVGRNMAVRKSFFKNSGGYEAIKSIVGGDDDLFIQRNATKDNTQVMLGVDNLVFTMPHTNWKAYWNQKIRHLSVGANYKFSDQLFLGFSHISHLLFLVMIIFSAAHSFFFPMLLFYLFIKLVSYRFAAGKMGININYILLPLVDILYAVLIPVIALWSKLEKDIKWKN
ncbi:glycosyltransferase [Ekhidna sp.]|uniref:glycosyltransferase n=1 Tax=Ekhidna sp. TaxID=2608089 RepID=UPI00329A053A